MNRHVNAIAGRLSLRPPQRHSLEILDRVTEIVPPKKGNDVVAALAAIGSEFPTVKDFDVKAHIELRDELEEWDKLSDEALAAFEKKL
jgi:hypothetical protein